MQTEPNEEEEIAQHEEILPAQQRYDFEKMIEQAMQSDAYGGGSVGGHASKDRPQTGEPKFSKAREAKKALLEKRKKYDPRAAAKGNKSKMEAKSKSPHGRSDSKMEVKRAPFTRPKLNVQRAEPSESPVPEEMPMMKKKKEVVLEEPLKQKDSEMPEELPPNESGTAPTVAPRPYLKRKANKVVIEKTRKKEKVESKARTDCWQRSKNKKEEVTVVYGNKAEVKEELKRTSVIEQKLK